VHTASTQAPVPIAVAVVLAGLAGVSACGTRHASAGSQVCLSTVNGVVSGPGALATTGLPANFHRSSGRPSVSALPSATYVRGRARPDSPKLQLTASFHPGPLSVADAGGWTVKSVVIGGHHAFVTSGPQHPRSTSAYWKPASGYLLTAGGYKLSPRMVLRAVRHVTFEPPGTISLPVVPGPIVSRNAAEAAATRSAQGPLRQARAKLSSWTEVATLSSAHTMRDAPAAPAPFARRSLAPSMGSTRRPGACDRRRQRPDSGHDRARRPDDMVCRPHRP
jgi:hypothetical protein